MRFVFALIMLTTLLFSYSYPPHLEVKMHNDALAPSLLNSRCLNRTTPTYENPIECAEAELLTVYPSVDSRISSEKNVRVLWRYALSYTSQDKTVTIDGCTSYFHKTAQDAELIANLSASFMNKTYVLENVSGNPLVLPIPLNELNKTDGSNLTLSLTGSIIFHYMFDRTISYLECDENGSCTCNENVYPSVPMNITRIINSNLTYEVEGGPLVHFLSKPVLHEQWIQNSQFEDLVFSKRRFYIASISLNNLSFGSAQFYYFNITEDPSRAWKISSYPASNFFNLSEEEVRTITSPVPIQQGNFSHKYIYIFNSSYSALGPHNITLNITDQFENNFSKRFEITNRLLTASGSFGEDNSTNISDKTIYRPSSPPSNSSFSLIIAGLGTLAIVVLVLALLKKE